MAFSRFHVLVQGSVRRRAGRSEQAGLLKGLYLPMQAALEAHEGQPGPAVDAGGLGQLQGLLDECRAERDALHSRLQQAQVWACPQRPFTTAETERGRLAALCSYRKAHILSHALRDRHAWLHLIV